MTNHDIELYTNEEKTAAAKEPAADPAGITEDLPDYLTLRQQSKEAVEENRRRLHNGLEDRFSIQNHKRLRWGYTTGSSATAAAKAAAIMLVTGKVIEETALETPKGILLHLLIEDIHIKHDPADPSRIISVSCAVRKDGGDDMDATHGLLIYSTVSRIPENQIRIDGGYGVGRVTRPGVDQPVGNAAINSTPRRMITEELDRIRKEYALEGGFSVLITVPGGAEAAKKTFNHRLGIEGGISILGTSGIVMPMSETALLNSMRAEMKMLYANGGTYLLITPGNYGETFAKSRPDLDRTFEMKSSNFVGDTIEMAEELGVKGILFVSHIGKFIKVSGGIMNTHSHQADCRAELLAAAALRAGCRADTCRMILDTLTTEDGLKILKEEEPDHFREAMDSMGQKILFYLNQKCQGRMLMGAIVFSTVYGQLTATDHVDELVRKLREEGEEFRKKYPDGIPEG
ncbi:MAG: cobalt-precorrin-5B (C(1))-methyltransferase CbiD [Eubacterium sp.]|nr:cobalt-precorrin-5B (C(1))-methyltransferase CbiD [Eubacterium sp.]